MIHPEIPVNEKERLQALMEYDILDTLPMEDYDNLTRIAAEICQTPIALIGLIDANRQWYLSAQGLGRGEAPRDETFCAHAINVPDQPMIVPDAREDLRFKDNPNVTGNPNVVFYLGVPLVNGNGYALGSLCILDHVPRELAPGQIEAMRALARQVMNLLERKRENMELQEKTRQLKEANAELNQFGYSISHDLNQPLSNVVGLMQILQNGTAGELGAQVKEVVDMALSCAVDLQQMFRDLLEYIQTGNRTGEKRFHTGDALGRAVSSLQTQLSESRGQVIIETSLPEIVGYEMDVQRLFQNLLGNALKFSRPDATPMIRVRAKENAGLWQFTVSDNGLGMKEEDAQKIFELFQRVHRQTEIPGTGIGLALCRRIVEKHGGTIWAESRPLEGSNFFFTLKP